MKSYPKKCCPRQTLLYVTEIWLASSPRRASPVKCIYTGNFQPYKAKPYMAKPYNLGYQDPAKEGWPSSHINKNVLRGCHAESCYSCSIYCPTHQLPCKKDVRILKYVVSVIYSTDSISVTGAGGWPVAELPWLPLPPGEARCCFLGTRKVAPTLQIMINMLLNGNHCTF